MLILIVAGGREKGRVYEFTDEREVILGRDGADVALTDSRVSRRHGRLWCDGGRWYVQDLDSRHGVYRNHDRINGRQPLKDGDYLQIGRTVMVVARVPVEVAGRTGMLKSHGVGANGWRHPKLILGGLGAAAAVLISLDVVSVWSARSGMERIEGRIMAAEGESDHERALRAELAVAMQQKVEHERRVETMIAAFQPHHDELMPQITAIRAALAEPPDVIGPLTTLAEAMKERGTNDAVEGKIDRALALLEQRGGEAEALATEFRAMIAAQPTVEQLAAAAKGDDGRTAAVLERVVDRLDQPPADPQLAQVNERLTRLAEQLETRGDAQFIRDQLAAVLDAKREGRDAPALADDPLMGQLLARVDALAAQDVKLDAIAEELKNQPYRNRAMLEEALAQAGAGGAGGAGEVKLAARLDDAMAELRGKSIADADELRRLIRREVAAVASPGSPGAPGDTPAERSVRETRLTKTEQAYKAAYDTGRRITIGAGVIDPGTGERAPGRTLDPLAAREAGHTSWRDWYLMDDFTERTRLNANLDASATADRPLSLPDPPATADASAPVRE